MKNKIRSLLFVFSATALLFSCGEAGVQIRIGDDFDTNLNIAGAQFINSVSPNETSTINQELREYGQFLSEVEVTRLAVTIENFEGATTGRIIINIQGNVFDTGAGFAIENNSSHVFTGNTLTNLGPAIQNGEITFSLTLTGDTNFGDNDFDIKITTSVVATASDDNL